MEKQNYLNKTKHYDVFKDTDVYKMICNR